MFRSILLFTLLVISIRVDASGVYEPKKSKSSSASESIENKLQLNDIAMIQNSTSEWNDEVVKVVEIYADGSRRVLRQNGEKVLVRKKNLAASLSPRSRTGCGPSHGTEICEGNSVFYPAHGTTLGIPEAKVKHVFENKRVVLTDGVDQPFSLNEIGVEVKCSPQKPSVCENTYVLGDGLRGGNRYTFEGPVEKVFSNGIVVVKSSAFWKFPIDVKAVNERVAATDSDIQNSGAVIMNRSGGAELKRDPASSVKVPVTRMLEPYNVEIADEVEKSQRGD